MCVDKKDTDYCHSFVQNYLVASLRPQGKVQNLWCGLQSLRGWVPALAQPYSSLHFLHTLLSTPGPLHRLFPLPRRLFPGVGTMPGT